MSYHLDIILVYRSLLSKLHVKNIHIEIAIISVGGFIANSSTEATIGRSIRKVGGSGWPKNAHMNQRSSTGNAKFEPDLSVYCLFFLFTEMSSMQDRDYRGITTSPEATPGIHYPKIGVSLYRDRRLPPPSRRRDEPQLSCNLCKRRKYFVCIARIRDSRNVTIPGTTSLTRDIESDAIDTVLAQHASQEGSHRRAVILPMSHSDRRRGGGGAARGRH